MIEVYALITLSFVFGFIIGRNFKRQAEVTSVVTDPMDEVIKQDWLSLCEPHIHKFEVGSVFGSGVSFNREGSKAMAVLLTEMSTRLDYAKHHAKKMRESA